MYWVQVKARTFLVSIRLWKAVKWDALNHMNLTKSDGASYLQTARYGENQTYFYLQQQCSTSAAELQLLLQKQRKHFKTMRNSTQLNVSPSSLVSALLFLLVPSQHWGDGGCPRQETNTAKLHHIWLRFNMFVLQKTAETSGHILFSKDILTYFGRSLPYVPCILPYILQTIC